MFLKPEISIENYVREMIIKVSQRAMKSLAALPIDIQAKARRAVEYLNSGNERSVKPEKLKGGRNLYSGRVNSKYRVIYSKGRGSIEIVDIIRVDEVGNIMRSES